MTHECTWATGDTCDHPNGWFLAIRLVNSPFGGTVGWGVDIKTAPGGEAVFDGFCDRLIPYRHRADARAVAWAKASELPRGPHFPNGPDTGASPVAATTSKPPPDDSDGPTPAADALADAIRRLDEACRELSSDVKDIADMIRSGASPVPPPEDRGE